MSERQGGGRADESIGASADAPGIDQRDIGEADYRNLAETLPQLAWMAEADGTIVWYNRRWYDYTGTTPGEMQGWGWRDVHHPDHIGRVLDRYRAAITAGEPWEDTFPLRGADGEYRWFLSQAMPLRDPDGRVRRWYGTNTDISRRRATEQRLRHSEERFRALVDASAAVVWNTSASGELMPPQPRWSAYTGQSEAAYQGWGWVDAVHPEDRAHAADTWARSVDERQHAA